jgi:hypothetical protein
MFFDSITLYFGKTLETTLYTKLLARLQTRVWFTEYRPTAGPLHGSRSRPRLDGQLANSPGRVGHDRQRSSVNTLPPPRLLCYHFLRFTCRRSPNCGCHPSCKDRNQRQAQAVPTFVLDGTYHYPRLSGWIGWPQGSRSRRSMQDLCHFCIGLLSSWRPL